jgi:signal transduction histidine kinase
MKTEQFSLAGAPEPVRDAKYTIRDITERKQLEERAKRATILEERSRMARDVHDTIAQGFTGIVLNLEAAEQASADLPEEVRNRISRARDVARQNLEEVRRSNFSRNSFMCFFPLRYFNSVSCCIRSGRLIAKAGFAWSRLV